MLFAPALALAVGAGGLAGTAAAAPRVPDPPFPIQVDMSSDVAQGLIDRDLFGVSIVLPPSQFASREVTNLRTLPPFVQRWQSAINRRNLAASIQAGEDYEAAWQAVEVYVNHRSLPLYRDIEVDTQFVIQAGLEQPSPDWPTLARLVEHLRQQINLTIEFVAAQPALHPLFDDLVPLRGVRAQLLISRDALNSGTGDVPKATKFFNNFKAGFPGVKRLIAVRSASDAQETQAALDAAAVEFAKPTPDVATLKALVATLLDRYGFGVNLLNAAARTSDVTKLALTADDKTALSQLNDVKSDLIRSLPKFPADPAGAAAGGATGPGSDFAKVQPTLEDKARLVNTAATLRRALANYALLAGNAATPVDKVKAANKTALEAVALAQQTIAGQFWTDPALQAFLDGLPKA
ncbi:MAG: hypothetical protein ACRDRI_13570 [Pseudonocardiaceae bacterium]